MPKSIPLIADLVEAWAPTGGGIRSYVEAKAHALTEEGRARHLLIVPGERDRWSEDGPRSVLTVRSPRIPGCSPYRLLLRHGRVLEALRRQRPSVLEVGSMYLLDRIIRSAREELGVFVSAFVHTDFPNAYVEPAVRAMLGPRAAACAQLVAQRRFQELHLRVDATLVASPRLFRRLQDQGVPRLVQISLGVELDRFTSAAGTPALRLTLGLGDSGKKGPPRLFTFLGRFDEEKRVRLLLDAFQNVPPDLAHFLLVGEGPLVEDVRARCRTFPHIHHLPYTRDRDQLAKILASSDIYLTAGPWETFGLSVLEAQSSGLPVLGVASGALLERVDPASGWLVPPDDVMAMSRKITEVAHLPQGTLDTMGRAARARAMVGGGWAPAIRQLAMLYGLEAPVAARPSVRSVAVSDS